MEFIIASLIGLVLILLCVALVYEILAHTWLRLVRLAGHPRKQILFSMLAIFFAHTVAVWLFAGAYYLMANAWDLGALNGQIGRGIMDYVYFSVVSYSSLGLGDVYPTGGLRMIVGIEAILGLIMIGWTVAFSYVVTEKYLLHRGGKDHPLSRKD